MRNGGLPHRTARGELSGMRAQRTAMTDRGKILRILQLDRGRFRTLLIVAACLLGRATWSSLGTGYALVLAGALLHLAAKGTLRIGSEVTMSGPYRWVRNPYYGAMLLIDTGLCVVARNAWLAAVALPVALAIYVGTILREEEALTRMFGAPYEDYLRRVPRLLPWRGSVRGLPPSTGFSWDNPQLVAGIVYARLVRSVAAPLLVFVGSRLLVFRAVLFSTRHTGDLVAIVVTLALLVVDRLLLRRSRHIQADLRGQTSGASGVVHQAPGSVAGRI